MKSLFTTMLAIGLFCQSQAADLFTPVQKTELRAPSVPLITSDPYLSIWSPYDKLNEGSTEHWTGTEHPLIGAVRVDGKVYRFMGKQTLEAILPMVEDEIWEGTTRRKLDRHRIQCQRLESRKSSFRKFRQIYDRNPLEK